jgi:hypothetical protein
MTCSTPPNTPKEAIDMSCSTENQSCGCCGIRWSYLFAVGGAFLIVALLVWAMRHYTTPPPLAAQRAAEREKNLADLRAAEAVALNSYGWIDQGKGVVRLTVDRAVELTAAAGADPAAFRKDLIARVEKATAVPPKAPEKPSAFE